MGSVGRSIEERRMRTEMQQRESDVRSPGIVKVVKFCEITMELFLHEGKIGKLNFKLLSYVTVQFHCNLTKPFINRL